MAQRHNLLTTSFFQCLIILLGFFFCVPVRAVEMPSQATFRANNYGLKQVFRVESDRSLFIGTAGGTDSLPTIVGNVIGTALSFIGIIFFILMVYAGILWMTARGNDEKTATAVQIIRAAIIGVIVIVGSYALTRFIFQVTVDGSRCSQTSVPVCAANFVGGECTPDGAVQGTRGQCVVTSQNGSEPVCGCQAIANQSPPQANVPPSNAADSPFNQDVGLPPP